MSETKNHRRTKKECYNIERNDIINQMNHIIGIDISNQIYLYEIETNEEIKTFLLNNIDNIKKYYKTGNWGYFSRDEARGKDNITGLIKSIYADSNYEIIKKLKIHTFNGVKKQYTLWDFRKK